jgi:aarF domain-containing kinase
MLRFAEIFKDDPSFYVPHVFSNLSSKCVLTMEYIDGKPVDACLNEPQEVRDYIAAKFMELCLKELFICRFMQTDPNWSNFLFGKHPINGEPRLILLDFGACRVYPKRFVDLYMRIFKAAYDGDTDAILHYSRKIGFLTGYESKVMEQAHCDSILVMGETLTSKEPYDFSKQDVTKRIQKNISVMLEHHLDAPPEELYSIHRKLSGAYLLANKLKAVVSCGPIFMDIYSKYEFDDDTK